MRIVFCGSGQFAVASLDAVLASEHELAAVATQPPRRAGRGGKLRPTLVAQAAGRAGIDVLEVPDINAEDAVAQLAAIRPDVIAVVDFGQMIRSRARETAAIDTINLHGSILPELRGAAPINWAIIRGCRRTGVTTFSLVDAMDAGDVYLEAAVDILPEDTAVELGARLAKIGAKTLCGTLDLLACGQAKPQPQDHSLATRAPILKKSDGLIDWSQPAEVVRNLIHGTWPWPGGRTTFHTRQGRRIDVTIARAAMEAGPAAGECGAIDDDGCVATGRQRLRILQIKPAGKKLMDWRDFENGYRPQVGDRFFSAES